MENGYLSREEMRKMVDRNEEEDRKEQGNSRVQFGLGKRHLFVLDSNCCEERVWLRDMMTWFAMLQKTTFKMLFFSILGVLKRSNVYFISEEAFFVQLILKPRGSCIEHNHDCGQKL